MNFSLFNKSLEPIILTEITQYLESKQSIENKKKNSFGPDLIRPFIANKKSLSAAFNIDGFYPEALPNSSTGLNTQLINLLHIVRENLGLVEVEKMICLYEVIQEMHRVRWRHSIAPIKIMTQRSMLYDAYLRHVPTLLSRFKYPDDKGTVLEVVA